VDQQDSDQLRRDTFGFHPLAIKDAESFRQRPKLVTYDRFVLLVMYGVSDAGQLTVRKVVTPERTRSRPW
jgi:Mg2+ and Co2+ transporter CorA